MTATRTILSLVRHGETSANQTGVWHGSTDTPLSERGHRQATRVADYLAQQLGEPPGGARALYASPLARARHTAEAIARRLSLSLQIESELSEYHLGSWEGLSYQVLHSEMHLWDEIRENPHFAPHGGESPLQVSERFAGALRRIASRHVGERVVVVTHGGAMSLGLAHLIDGHYSRWRRVMDNCGVSELAFDPSLELISFTHTGHLDGV